MRTDTPVSCFLASTDVFDCVAPRDGVTQSRTPSVRLEDDAPVAERLWLNDLRVSRPGVHE